MALTIQPSKSFLNVIYKNYIFSSTSLNVIQDENINGASIKDLRTLLSLPYGIMNKEVTKNQLEVLYREQQNKPALPLKTIPPFMSRITKSITKEQYDAVEPPVDYYKYEYSDYMLMINSGQINLNQYNKSINTFNLFTITTDSLNATRLVSVPPGTIVAEMLLNGSTTPIPYETYLDTMEQYYQDSGATPSWDSITADTIKTNGASTQVVSGYRYTQAFKEALREVGYQLDSSYIEEETFTVKLNILVEKPVLDIKVKYLVGSSLTEEDYEYCKTNDLWGVDHSSTSYVDNTALYSVDNKTIYTDEDTEVKIKVIVNVTLNTKGIPLLPSTILSYFKRDNVKLVYSNNSKEIDLIDFSLFQNGVDFISYPSMSTADIDDTSVIKLNGIGTGLIDQLDLNQSVSIVSGGFVKVAPKLVV